MGKVIEVHPGSDGAIRVVTLRTANGEFKRPIAKLCVLPVETDTVETTTTPESLASNAKEIDTPTGRITRSKSKKNVTFANLGVILVLGVLICGVLGDTTNQTLDSVINHHGMLLQDVGKTYIQGGQWTLISYINLTTYFNDMEILTNQVMEFETLCQKAKYMTDGCETSVMLARRQLERIRETNTIFNAARYPQRTKRFVVLGATLVGAGIGAMVSHVISQQEVAACNKNIEILKGNEDHMLELIKNHTSILETTSNILRQEDVKMSHQFTQFQHQIREIQTAIHEAEKWVNRNENIELTRHRLHYMDSHISFMLSELERIQERLIDVVVDLHHGTIHPMLIRPSQLAQQMTMIRTTIQNKNLSINYLSSVAEIYKLHMEHQIIDNKLILKISIPLTENEQFTIFKPIPIPFIVTDSFMWINFNMDYVAINNKTQEYFSMSQMDVNHIKRFQNSQLFEHQPHRYTLHTPACIAQLYQGIKPTMCTFSTTAQYTDFAQISHGVWLYYTVHENQLEIACGQHVYHPHFARIGVIQLVDLCILRHVGTNITTHSSWNSTLHISLPNMHLPAHQIAFNHTKLVQFLNNTDLREMNPRNDVIDKLNGVDSQLHDLEKQQYINNLVDIHHFSFLYSGIIIFTIFLLYKYCQQSRINHNKFIV